MNKTSNAHAPHIVPLKIYLSVTAALFILTIVTVLVAKVDLGGWNVVVALSVAALKSALVALIFMHLLYDKKIYIIILLTSLVFMALFIILTMFDTMRRGDIHNITSDPINKNAALYENIGTLPDSLMTTGDSLLIESSDSLKEKSNSDH